MGYFSWFFYSSYYGLLEYYSVYYVYLEVNVVVGVCDAVICFFCALVCLMRCVDFVV